MRTSIPSIAVADAIGKHNEELLRDPKTGLMPWETRLGRLLHRLEDTGRRIARKGRLLRRFARGGMLKCEGSWNEWWLTRLQSM